MNCVTERVTVEIGGFSSGVYHFARVTDYDVDEAEVEQDARDAFEGVHGSPGGFGNFGVTGSEARSVEPRDTGQPGHFKRVKKYTPTAGYMRAGKPVRASRQRRWVRVWVPARPAVAYERQVTVDTDKTRDTRGGERRGRWK